MTVDFFYPSGTTTEKMRATGFLYYYFSVYVNLSKNSFLMSSQGQSLKADAKVRLFSEPPNFFKKKISFLCKKVSRIDLNQDAFKIYLFIYRGEK